jgi:hypothetical protein
MKRNHLAFVQGVRDRKKPGFRMGFAERPSVNEPADVRVKAAIIEIGLHVDVFFRLIELRILNLWQKSPEPSDVMSSAPSRSLPSSPFPTLVAPMEKVESKSATTNPATFSFLMYASTFFILRFLAVAQAE